jgi:hypothetical protein
MSRRYQSAGISGSPSKERLTPLTLSWIMFLPHISVVKGATAFVPRTEGFFEIRPVIAPLDSSKSLVISASTCSSSLHLIYFIDGSPTALTRPPRARRHGQPG